MRQHIAPLDPPVRNGVREHHGSTEERPNWTGIDDQYGNQRIQQKESVE
ncbi:hypothetical protein [Streptomyces sp. NPDC002067]